MTTDYVSEPEINALRKLVAVFVGHFDEETADNIRAAGVTSDSYLIDQATIFIGLGNAASRELLGQAQVIRKLWHLPYDHPGMLRLTFAIGAVHLRLYREPSTLEAKTLESIETMFEYLAEVMGAAHLEAVIRVMLAH